MHRSTATIMLLASGCGDVAPAEVAAAATSSSEGDGSSSQGSTSESGADACELPCADLAGESGVARCYACRCKIAFDGWLPPTGALQCSEAAVITTYTVDLSVEGPALEPAPISTSSCANPSHFADSCMQGSRMGELVHGDVVVRWICRDPYLDFDGSLLFGDVGVVGQNLRTGAACFWDDRDDVTHDDDLPPLDLELATEQERQRFEENFYFTDGENCTPCHDHDPFIYTPHLQSIPWRSFAASKGPYSLVELDGGTRPTGMMHLVSPRAAPCTGCHRIGSGKTCSALAADAMGVEKKVGTYEQAMIDATLPGSPRWQLAYWMPSQPQTDRAVWEAAFADAREHILDCCAAPGEDIGDCVWEAVPAQ